MNIKHGRGYVYALEYHIVWCVKYRRKILDEEISNRLREILNKIAEDNGVILEEFNTDLDHVHILVSATPQTIIPNMIKAFKGVSARILKKEFGEKIKKVLWGDSLWNPSYFIATVSENTESQIRTYIQEQRKGDPNG